MTTQIATKNGQQLARPLKVLVPLINRDIKNAEHAGQMFYTAAGGKLIEARGSFERDETKTARTTAIEFWNWFRQEKQILYSDGRPVSETTAKVWMGLWESENVRGERHQSQEAYIRSRRSPASARGSGKHSGYRDYRSGVDRLLTGINAKEMAERKINEAKESELERKLGLQLIKIGYGVLATKLHPDKGGSHDAMRRLNKVAKSLRQVYSRVGLTY